MAARPTAQRASHATPRTPAVRSATSGARPERKVRRTRGRPADDELRSRRRSQILDVAARLFAAHGYAATDVQQVADDAGVGKGTVYRYFPNKEQLFLAAVDRGMERLGEHVAAARAGVADPLEQMERSVPAYLAFFDSHPEYVELLLLERAVFRDRRKPTYFQHRERRIRRWMDLIRRLVRQGRVRPLPPQQIVDVLGGAVYGRMFTNFLTGRPRPLANQAREILDVIFHGILSEAERSRRVADAARHNGRRPVAELGHQRSGRS
jgi:AcrR family transcriptional regulator